MEHFSNSQFGQYLHMATTVWLKLGKDGDYGIETLLVYD